MFAGRVKHLFGKHLFGKRVDTEQMFGQTSEHPFGTVHCINRTGQPSSWETRRNKGKTMARTIDPLLNTRIGVRQFASAPSARPVRTVRSADLQHSGRVRETRPSARTFQRRRRIVGASVVFALATGFISTGAFASNPSTDQQVVPRTVVAQPGDTLWDIARGIVSTGQIGDYVGQLVELNGPDIQAGQVIRIP